MSSPIDIIAIVPTVLDNGSSISDAFANQPVGSVGGVGIAGGNIFASFASPFVTLAVNGQIQAVLGGFTIVKIAAELNHDVSPGDIGLGDVIQVVAGGITVTAAVLAVTAGVAAAAPLIALLGLTAAIAQLSANQDGHTIGDVGRAISSLVNRNFTNAQNWTPPRDPLVLDLNGGGIQTSAIDPARPILFDMDGDGTKHATGWVAAGEAIVVRDINGNGLIDSGRELFGDATLLTRGLRAGQNAANGFEALADLDLDANGISDGKFDANDVAYSTVKLWQDTNQDGISQAGELRTFTELGVASINVSGTASNINLGGGNTQAFTGSFTRTNGQSGNAGTAELAGSLLLAANNFYREFSVNPPVTTTAKALPQMQGSGTVRDLREAMSLGNLAAQTLQNQVAQFAAGVFTTKSVADCAHKSWARGPFDARKRVLSAAKSSKLKFRLTCHGFRIDSKKSKIKAPKRKDKSDENSRKAFVGP